MLNKRLIFVLLFDGKHFVLSRNFRLQKVGDIEWLEKNYFFRRTASYIDELIILNVDRGRPDPKAFEKILKTVARGCFAPIAAGGGIRTAKDAEIILNSGADKVVVNSILHTNYGVVEEIAQTYGKQCIIASLDLKKSSNSHTYTALITNGSISIGESPSSFLQRADNAHFGEVLLNSIDRDGTGQGLNSEVIDLIPSDFTKPVIVVGGVGNVNHIESGLRNFKIDAVATANLFNFVGNGLEIARKELIQRGISLPMWQ